MRTVEFYGHSDDVACADDDEFYGLPMALKVSGGVDHLGPPREEGLIVYMDYAPKSHTGDVPGCWMIGILPLDEDVPLPSWPMRWSARGYTTVLQIDIPDGVTVQKLED